MSDPTLPDQSAAPVVAKAVFDERSSAPARLTRRGQFLNAAKGKRYHTTGFTLQSAPSSPTPSARAVSRGDRQGSEVDGRALECRSSDAEPDLGGSGPARFGITVTKKTGGAVVRNRIRRRLKESLRLIVPLPARLGHDYVIVARREALRLPFTLLRDNLGKALARIDSGTSRPSPGSQSSQGGKVRTSHKTTKGKAPKA